MTDIHIQVNKLSFRRAGRIIFDNIDLAIPKGKIIGIMGPSGTGKTTLLRLITRQLVPSHGSIDIDGKNIFKMSDDELTDLRKSIGMLFQSSALFTHLSVFENVAFPLRVHTKLSESMIRDLVLIKLQAVGLRGAQALMPSELSGGMSRRIALARAIVLDPSLVLYDEPFVGQDPIAVGVLLELIKKTNKSMGITSIIVSHDLKETFSVADYLYIIANGKIIGEGTPNSITQSKDPLVEQFVKGLMDGPVPFHYPAKDFYTSLLGENDYK